ncbi:MAG: FHA domain-containing protein, partial [Acetatifactor sp.]|nr:FHA domain-containing protein [Acetatifactor sp.]
VTIGKKNGEVDVVLDDSSVSRLHARFIRELGHYYVEDLNATNGTFKNGLRLQPYEKRELEEGDEIKFGRKMLVFR